MYFVAAILSLLSVHSYHDVIAHNICYFYSTFVTSYRCRQTKTDCRRLVVSYVCCPTFRTGSVTISCKFAPTRPHCSTWDPPPKLSLVPLAYEPVSSLNRPLAICRLCAVSARSQVPLSSAHKPAHKPAHTLALSLVHPLVRPLARSPACPLVRSPARPLAHKPVCSLPIDLCPRLRYRRCPRLKLRVKGSLTLINKYS